jgi:hypothetical protein
MDAVRHHHLTGRGEPDDPALVLGHLQDRPRVQFLQQLDRSSGAEQTSMPSSRPASAARRATAAMSATMARRTAGLPPSVMGCRRAGMEAGSGGGMREGECGGLWGFEARLKPRAADPESGCQAPLRPAAQQQAATGDPGLARHLLHLLMAVVPRSGGRSPPVAAASLHPTSL